MIRVVAADHRYRLLVVVGLISIVSVAAASGTAVAHSDSQPTHTAGATVDGRIVELYPNPTTPQNHGEYVIVELESAGNWTLSDGEATAQLPDRTGEFAVTRRPSETAAHTNVTLVEAESYLRLSTGGEMLELRQNGAVVDTVSYDDAPESHRWHRDRDPHWQADGLRPREPAAFESVPVEAFVLPDSSDAPAAAIEETDRRLLLAAYTLASERVVDELIAAHDRGVNVAVLVEGGPVGGMSTRQAARLDELTEAGIEVRVMTGDQARFRYHHAKYAVADDRVVVVTENWKPSGTGGRQNRGWGVTVDDTDVADELAAVFDHDAMWEDTVRWDQFRTDVDTQETKPATGSYPETQPPLTTTAESLTLLTAPDNAADELVDRINRTDDRLLIIQPRIGDVDFRLLRAAIRAADRGVDVRILLGNQWYDEEDNQALATALRETSERDDLPLEVRLAEDNSRFGKIHAKGIVADDTVVVGSLNWNTNSAEDNREVLVAVEDEAVADYYAEVFDGDWSGDHTREIPVGVLVVTTGIAGGTVLLLKRRLEFAAKTGP